MLIWDSRIFRRALPLALLATVAVSWGVLAGVQGLGSAQDWVRAGALLVPAAVAASLSRAAAPERRPIRLTSCFVLAAPWLLPPVQAMGAAAALAIVAAGSGLVGPAGPRLTRTAGAAVALAPLALLALPAASPTPLPAWQAMLWCVGALALIQGAAFLLVLLLGDGEGGPLAAGFREELPRSLVELLNAPLAVLLVALARAEAAWALTGVAAAILATAWMLRHLDRTQSHLRTTERALSRRITELATLHAIAREIVASRDRSRLFRILERECAKILDVTGFMVALSDTDAARLRALYRRERGRPAREDSVNLVRGVAHGVWSDKRPVRIGDISRAPEPLRDDPWILADVRSVLAVPLMVEDRVIGVLGAQSRRPRAYDSGHQEVLTTVAQQAAVAIDSVRHYEMATVDSLTGLYVRDWFFRRVREEYDRARRYGGNFAVLMIDLDGFKELNDRYGHLAGDRYLEGFGGLIHDRLRSADLGCRYGGDEFCLLLPETDVEGGRAIAERLREAVSELSVEFEGRALKTTVSIGLAGFRENDPGDLRGLLTKADQALYRAKRGGRDRVEPFAA
jgi:diguanylate cyclase (GGDEF)-like protein